MDAGKGREVVRRPMRAAMGLLALCTLTPAPVLAGDAPSAAMPRDAAHFRDIMLAAHNGERAARGVPKLAWSDELAADAAQSATRLAQEPDPIAAHHKSGGAGNYGENLWAGTRDAYAYEEMAESWLEERALYLDAPVPDISRSGNWADVGHYSQIIWAGTRRVGCALHPTATLDVLVCRYDPAGNVYGHRASVDYAGR
ncbi:CAP domain-containing protein [Sphingobium sp. B8D3B]|uniref:CAP domain-containing protein n=1 Tax=Sphingobium sp. B8D3B TaxID=2940585 RepID=UPI0022245A0C|nr:CAP domain-containing protein [Sphingobium sp. B8D3B]MCW2396720.1 hypothetical protein [Sphingobium sp. B8D3B]